MKKYNLTEKEVTTYILIHSTGDFSMNQTLGDFYKKVKGWWDRYAEYYQ